MAEYPERDERLGAALRFVLRRYLAQVRRWPFLASGALLLPAVGDVLTLYAPPLVVARLLGAFAGGRQLTADQVSPTCSRSSRSGCRARSPGASGWR